MSFRAPYRLGRPPRTRHKLRPAHRAIRQVALRTRARSTRLHVNHQLRSLTKPTSQGLLQRFRLVVRLLKRPKPRKHHVQVDMNRRTQPVNLRMMRRRPSGLPLSLQNLRNLPQQLRARLVQNPPHRTPNHKPTVHHQPNRQPHRDRRVQPNRPRQHHKPHPHQRTDARHRIRTQMHTVGLQTR